SSGGEADAGSDGLPAISFDGSIVAFRSAADDLVANDTNGTVDCFVHDRTTGATTRVSVTSAGAEGHGWCGDPRLSEDGRYVFFVSLATALVAHPTSGLGDVFLHDRTTGETRVVSHDCMGVTSAFSSQWPDCSADARFVTFASFATDFAVAG